jgi:hypothetical protein
MMRLSQGWQLVQLRVVGFHHQHGTRFSLSGTAPTKARPYDSRIEHPVRRRDPLKLQPNDGNAASGVPIGPVGGHRPP